MHNKMCYTVHTIMHNLINLTQLETYCKAKGIENITSLSKLSGVHRNTIRGFFQGKSQPFSPAFIKLATALDVDPEELIRDPLALSYEVLVKESIERNLKNDLDIAYFIFGSRAENKKARKFSDLDLGISGGTEKIDAKRFLQLKESFSGLFEDLPIKVDLANFDQAPDWFLNELKQKPIFLCGNKENYFYILGYLDAKKTR